MSHALPANDLRSSQTSGQVSSVKVVISLLCWAARDVSSFICLEKDSCAVKLRYSVRARRLLSSRRREKRVPRFQGNGTDFTPADTSQTRDLEPRNVPLSSVVSLAASPSRNHIMSPLLSCPSTPAWIGAVQVMHSTAGHDIRDTPGAWLVSARAISRA